MQLDIDEDLNDRLSKLDFKKVRFLNLLEKFKADFMTDTFFSNSPFKQGEPEFDGFESCPVKRIRGARIVLTKEFVKQTKNKRIDRELQIGKREDRVSRAKSPGYRNIKIEQGNYFYNRCHLIAYQFVNKKAIYGQFFTGTRYLNDDRDFGDEVSMLHFEDRVWEWLNEVPEMRVYYQVTPVYRENEVIPRGVRMTAVGFDEAHVPMEVNGKGYYFDIYIYNVYPGYEINYSTGDTSKINSGRQG